MQLSNSVLLALLSSSAYAASSITLTRTVTNNGMTYTKILTQEYTGQATTEPTLGTYTTSITVKGKDKTYTKIMTNTYGQVTTVSTQNIITGPDETYTRPASAVVHTTEASSWFSSFSLKNEEASKAISAASASASAAGSTAKSSSAGSSSSTGGAAYLGAGVGAIGMAAALLL